MSKVHQMNVRQQTRPDVSRITVVGMKGITAPMKFHKCENWGECLMLH